MLAATIRISSELIKDSQIDLEKYLADTFVDRLAETEEETFINGDGVDKPTGLMQSLYGSAERST